MNLLIIPDYWGNV